MERVMYAAQNRRWPKLDGVMQIVVQAVFQNVVLSLANYVVRDVSTSWSCNDLRYTRFALKVKVLLALAEQRPLRHCGYLE